MNIVIRTREIRWRLPASPALRLPQPNLPTYIYLELLALIIVALVVVNWTLIVRQDAPLPANPLTPYIDTSTNLPEAISYTRTLRKGNCTVVSMSNEQFCTSSPSDGPFTYITGTLNNGVVRWTSFAVRKGALTI